MQCAATLLLKSCEHVPFTKWKDEYPNREVGEIVFVHYPGLKKAEYRMGKVSKVLPDQQGKVRTLEVMMRPKDKRTDGSVRYIPKDLETMTVPVQRTALLMPRSEVIANAPSHPIMSTITSPLKSPPVPDATLTSGYVIPAGVIAYIPAIQLKQYKQYDMNRQEAGDMKLEVGLKEVNVWKNY